ncbi:hypothetical protein, partial [Escherichia fergusonii]|uniref:hypothetical protein n=1 Tax=Escherichia fergusonii TaxID=564 RepID=UPI001C5CA9ED
GIVPQSEEGATGSGSFDPGNPLTFIAQLAHELGLDVLFNGRMVIRNQRYRAKSPEQIREVQDRIPSLLKRR